MFSEASKLSNIDFGLFINMNTGHVDVVEDDDSLRNSISDLLSLVGYRVRTWRDAESFLGDLPQTAPAVVVTDMRMPGRSGVELHAELLARGRSMPVIYISGESSVPQTISAMKMGALDFWSNPSRARTCSKRLPPAWKKTAIRCSR